MKTKEMNSKELHMKLMSTFADNEIEWRVQQGGKDKNGKPWLMVIPYIDARTVMDRLDDVFGPMGWKDEYEIRENGVVCTISVWDGTQWISKCDGSEFTNIEEFKGGISKSMVRAAVKWGIGRYIYHTPTVFAVCTDKHERGLERSFVKLKDNTSMTVYWKKPKLSEYIK